MPAYLQENPNLRKSSKNKASLENAIELDNNLNSGSKPKEVQGFLNIGEDRVAQIRRENEKKERQAEYQAFLSKQKQDKMSPRQLIQRLNSASNVNHNSAIQESPNKGHRNLVKASGPSRPLELQNNILGQPMHQN